MNINSYEDFCLYQNVSRETYDKFKVFEATLVKWQRSINLISKSTINDIFFRHLLDSSQLYPFVCNKKGNIFDFGTGAGFPGLVLAIMGQKKICLVESDQKKCTFLREVAMLCETEVSIKNTRIENLEYVDVDLIMSRALAPLSKLINYVELFLNKSPVKKKSFPNMLFLKGKSYKKEILDLSINKKFFFSEYPSLTDKYGKILYFSSSNMLKNHNETKI
jgi:16S rRNA (guanine527-N7)-methyltransferase